MKTWLKIGSFIILLFVLTAEDCSDAPTEFTYEERQRALFSGIENEFLKEQVGLEDLKAFEKRSLQMFTELIDYVNIYADTSLTEDFRKLSRQMVADLFISEEAFESFLTEFNLSENKQKSMLYFEGTKPLHLSILAHTISENLTQNTELSYSGSINFTLSSGITGLPSDEKFLEIQLQKSPKQFGINTIKVWKVHFGEIQ